MTAQTRKPSLSARMAVGPPTEPATPAGAPTTLIDPPTEDTAYLPEPKRSVFNALATVTEMLRELVDNPDTDLEHAIGSEALLAYQAGVKDCVAIVAQVALRLAGWPGREARR